MEKFQKIFKKIISEARMVSSTNTAINGSIDQISEIDLLKLQKQIEEIFNERCDDYIQGNNTKESPIRASFSGKAYGEGYSLFLTIYNGQAYIEPDSSPYVFTRDSLRKAWLNRANELIQRYNIKFAQFCINKD